MAGRVIGGIADSEDLDPGPPKAPDDRHRYGLASQDDHRWVGAGAHCDGQVLVIHDMLGLFDDFTPKFVKRYADIKEVMTGAVKSFISDVRERKFPGAEHSFR